VCTTQLATPSKLRRVSSGDATHDYRVPLSEIRARWISLAPRWGRVVSEEHQSALAAVDIALSYPAFLRSFRDRRAAPRSTSVTLHFPTYSATVAVDVGDGKPPVDKHGVWRATYERDGARTELVRKEALCGEIWSNQVDPQCGLEHPRLKTAHKKVWLLMSWRIMCLCREVDRYSPFSYRFRLALHAPAADGLLVITSRDDATVTLRKPMSKKELEFRVGSVLRIQQIEYPTSFLRVVGMVIEGGALRAIRFERWSQSGSAWKSWPDIPMLPATYDKSKETAWCWDWQGAELAAPGTVPEANFGRRFV
jgi:hypothetical protein